MWDWIIPNDIWKDFRLDHIVYISAWIRDSLEGTVVTYQYTLWKFYQETYDLYQWPAVIDRRHKV